MGMLIEDSQRADAASAIRQLLAGRVTSIRALDFVSSAAKANASDARYRLLGNALETAAVLINIDADDETVAAALIVASMPRSAIDSANIANAFGSSVWDLVSGVLRAGRIDSIRVESGAGPSGPGLEAMRKMLLALADDVRVVLIKLAERVVFMRSATKADDATRRAAGQQTKDLFAP